MTNGANASYVNADFAAYVLYMRVNFHVICKMESDVFFAVIENDMTFCSNEREVQFKFFAHLFGRIGRHSVFASFSCNLFSIIQYLTSEMHISTEEIAL